MNTSKIWLSKIYESPRGLSFWIKIGLASLLGIYLIKELYLNIGLGWDKFETIFQLQDLINTGTIFLGSSILAIGFGAPLAFIFTNYKFPGSKVFSFLLLFPMVIPMHVYAFSYKSFFGYSGPWHYACQNFIGSNTDYIFFLNTKNIYWILFWQGISAIPFVYLIFQNFFRTRLFIYSETLKTLNFNRGKAIFKVIFPLIKPILVSSLFLMIFLVFNEYGASKFNGVNTVTTQIVDNYLSDSPSPDFKKWIGILALIIGLIYFLFNSFSKGNNLVTFKNPTINITQKNLNGLKLAPIIAVCIIILIMSFILPLAELIRIQYNSVSWVKLQTPFVNTLLISFFATTTALIVNGLTSIILTKQQVPKNFTKILGTGLVLPGIISGAIVILFANDANSTYGIISGNGSSNDSFVILFALIIAYCIYALGVKSHFKSLLPENNNTEHIENESKIKSKLLYHSLIKKISGGISQMVICILIIQLVNELPIYLLANFRSFQTLTGYGFELAYSALLPSASAAALLNILICSIPLFIIAKSQKY